MDLDQIIRTPGLIHIAEQIFSNLDRQNLLQCQKVNENWASFLRNPWFWYNRMKQNTTLSEVHQEEWSKFCEKLKKLDQTKDMTQGVNFIYECLEHSVILNEVYQSAAKKGHTETIKILVPLTDNPNAPDIYGGTPIHQAARNGYTEIVNILVTLTENPNAPNKWGETPIFWAALNGHTEIVKIFLPLTDNPNTSNNTGETPIYWGAQNGHTEVVKILAPLTDNPNASNSIGETPIY